MEQFNFVDLIVGALILILGIKGVINGFFKEAFGIVGIVGGVYFGSRYAELAGGVIDTTLYKFDAQASMTLAGFLLILGLFWVGALLLGSLLARMVSASGLGEFDRILGFAFGAGKIFLIFSIISYALYNIEVIRLNAADKLDNSILFPLLYDTGAYIMEIDISKFKQE